MCSENMCLRVIPINCIVVFFVRHFLEYCILFIKFDCLRKKVSRKAKSSCYLTQFYVYHDFDCKATFHKANVFLKLLWQFNLTKYHNSFNSTLQITNILKNKPNHGYIVTYFRLNSGNTKRILQIVCYLQRQLKIYQNIAICMLKNH